MDFNFDNLRMVLRKHMITWPQEDDLDAVCYEINRIISQLDDVAIGYEAKWGVGRLEAIASRSDLGDKFQRQIEKLNEAIEAKDGVSVRHLAEGCIRAYDALERNALALGEQPRDVVWFEYKFGSLIYRIVKNLADARASHKPDEKDVVVMTGEELVKYYHKDAIRVYHDRVFENKNPLPDFNFDKGDDIPI